MVEATRARNDGMTSHAVGVEGGRKEGSKLPKTRFKKSRSFGPSFSSIIANYEVDTPEQPLYSITPTP